MMSKVFRGRRRLRQAQPADEDMPAKRPNKALGQHFLHDQNIVDKIVSALNIKATDTILEIGPGLGALTKAVLPLTAKVFAVEIDRNLIEILKKECDAEKLTLFQESILDFNLALLAKEAPLRIIGNIPYNISSPIIFHLLKYLPLMKDIHLMVQKEVGERIAAKPGSKTYGRLSIMVQYYCQPTLLFKVKNSSFTPPPKVESVVLRLLPIRNHGVIVNNHELFGRIVANAFSMRRKKISNGLKKIISADDLQKIGIDPGERAENLAVEKFVQIENWLSAKKD
jgi:16S rRNA (adenine1518-N6/adenine1519-N6)-dimethyltransferase